MPKKKTKNTKKVVEPKKVSKPYSLKISVNGEEFKTEAKDMETALTEFVNSPVFPLGAKTNVFVVYSKGKNRRQMLWHTPEARSVFRQINLKPKSLSVLAVKLTEQLG